MNACDGYGNKGRLLKSGLRLEPKWRHRHTKRQNIEVYAVVCFLCCALIYFEIINIAVLCGKMLRKLTAHKKNRLCYHHCRQVHT